MDTLILDIQGRPARRAPWQDALLLVFSGRAIVVDEYVDRSIRSMALTIQMPSIVQYIKGKAWLKKKVTRFNRRNVWIRDNGHCQYCNKAVPMTEFTIDHVTPRCEGGRSAWNNVVVACNACNQKKKGRTPVGAGMRLRTEPKRPKGTRMFYTPVIRYDESMPRSWRDILNSVKYWHSELEA